ncbi:hypothetical protein BV25DRAFT_1876394 [Artomyces pyxidatus]|uniref:Uncharacterized protein n=1 Tax=Artomyces pyxidatus TaxID=48021 RepID=A0ACB8TGZ8_9AGAM|nr:hypothetical protein BV25DRAFT_1876394 [Artomyces pyxidatus]
MFSSLRQVSRRGSALRISRTPVCRPAALTFSRTLVTKKYTADHESISFDDEAGLGVVTITEYAQKSLGDVVFVELPEVGSTVASGDAVGAVESVKAASDIYSPVSGEVIAINEELGGQPSLLNKSPEEKGWLFKVKLSDPAEMDALLTAEAYKEHCES